ncbi:MAG: hypothetical protein AAF919_17650 [Pseudomonadota bacterium]
MVDQFPISQRGYMTMTRIQISNSQFTGETVTQNHFGGNAVYIANTDRDSGDLYDNYEDAVEALGLQAIRFPAGRVEALFDDGMVVNGQIIPEVREFLTWARAEGHPAVLVLPTNESYAGAAETELFTRLVLQEFGDVVTAFEIGNEYWQEDMNPGGVSRETEYGRIASDIAEAVEAASRSTGRDVDILIQTANAAGQGSSYRGDHVDQLGAGLSERERWDEANSDIIDALSADAISAIDGIIHHFYWNNFFAGDPDNNRGYRMDWHTESWAPVLGNDMEFYVTEWNVQKDRLELHGLASAGAMITMVADMIEAGVDHAMVWPPQHNTRNDLAGGRNRDVIVDEETGIVVNSVNGAIFDMMSDALVGLQRLDLTMTGASDQRAVDSEVVVHGYGSQDTIVLYVASVDDAAQSVDLLLDAIAPNYSSISAIHLGYDRSSSDGQRSAGAGTADMVMIDGQPYHYNEDDVRAEITTLSEAELVRGGNLSVDLNPFEVVQITIDLGTSGVQKGAGAVIDDDDLVNLHPDRPDRTEAARKAEMRRNPDQFEFRGQIASQKDDLDAVIAQDEVQVGGFDIAEAGIEMPLLDAALVDTIAETDSFLF